jgi:cell division septum initiation protein DivIVA
MDILHLIDRLEEIIKEGRRVPFSDLRLVDERRVWPLLDQMRISIPDEMRRAERILREKERTKAQATEEAERIIALARQEAVALAASHSVTQTAEEEAAAIRERARQEAQKIVAGADDYAFDVLCDLEQDLRRALTVIENGIRAVEARQGGRTGEAVTPSGKSESESETRSSSQEEVT